jgi:hypothetical protein
MAFIRDIEDALLTLLNSELNIPVKIAHDGSPEPVGDYAALSFTAADKIHRNTINSYETTEGFVERLKQDFLVRFNLRFYGDSCYNNAFESQAILGTRSIQEELYTFSSLSFIEGTSIQNIPELRETRYIQRALYDFKVLTGFEYTRLTDWFDKVSYEGEYITPDGGVLLTTSETVSASDT